jgi:hypothetical protein
MIECLIYPLITMIHECVDPKLQISNTYRMLELVILIKKSWIISADFTIMNHIFITAMSLRDYLEENNLPDEPNYRVDEVGELFRFSDVFKSPIIEVGTANYWDDYFNYTTGYVHLPFKHLRLFYTLNTCSLVWTCRHCNYWCELFDCTIMEEHLCLNCRHIPEEDKSQLIRISLDRCRDHLNRLQNT